MCSYLSLRVTSEGLHNLPDSGDNPYGVAAHHEHHYVHIDSGQHHLPLTKKHTGTYRGPRQSGRQCYLLEVVHVIFNFPDTETTVNSSFPPIKLLPKNDDVEDDEGNDGNEDVE